VPVHDLGEVDGRAYFAMDRIEGRSLGQIIEREGPLPPRRAFEIAASVARALEHAHRSGIVHRDVKPENVLVDEGGRVFLTDFGLARDLDLDAKLTATGQFVGTPAYAPPEQLHGRPTDARSDVYSLGATLYEAVTGRPPFKGDSFPSTVYSVLHESPPRIRKIVPTVARDAEAVILACLEKEPALRYASAALLEADLERFLRGESVRARSSGPIRRAAAAARRRPVLAIAALLLAASAAMTVGYLGQLRYEVKRLAEQSSELDASARRLNEAHRVADERLEREEARRDILASLPVGASTEAALAALASALAIDPDFWDGHRDRAVLLRRLAAEERRRGHEEAAALAARQARAEVAAALAFGLDAPRAPLLLLDAEICRRDLRDAALAKGAYEKLAATGARRLAAYARARLALAASDPAGAIALQAREASGPPGSGVGTPPSGTATASSGIGAALVPAVYLDAEAAIATGDPARALEELDALTVYDDAERYALRARALAALGRSPDADLARAHELDPREESPAPR
jgi:hypothetical protein